MPDRIANISQSRIKYAPRQRDARYGTDRAVSVKDAVLQRCLQVAASNHKHLRWRGFFVLAKVVATAEESSFGDDNRHVIKLVGYAFCTDPALSLSVEELAASLSTIWVETANPFASTPLPNAAEHHDLVFV
jgi:hypothetical protein